MILASVLLGLVVGLVSSVLGLGGGVLVVPLLPLITDLDRKESVFVSLIAILVIVSVNTYFFYRDKKINFKAVMLFGPTTAVGAVVSSLFISPYFSNESLRIVLASVLLIWALLNIFKVFKSSGQAEQHDSSFLFTKKKKLFYFSMAFIAGALSGLLGIGSGLIISLLLVGLIWVRSDEISPSSNGVMVFTTLAGVLIYSYQLGWVASQNYVTKYSLPLIVGALVSAPIGRRFQNRLTRKNRAVILILLLLGLSVKTFLN